MIGVRGVNDDVCFGGLGCQEIGAVEVAVDKFGFGILGGDLCAFVAVTNKGGDLQIWISGCNSI